MNKKEIVVSCVMGVITLGGIVTLGVLLFGDNKATQGAITASGNATSAVITQDGDRTREAINALPTAAEIGKAVATNIAEERKEREAAERKEREENERVAAAKRAATKSSAPPAVTPDDISALIHGLGEDVERVWKTAGKNLQEQGVAAVPQLVKALEGKNPIRHRAKWCLFHIGEASLDELINKGFDSKCPDAREAAVSAVVTIGGYSARDKLQKASQDTKRPMVMYTAEIAIERLYEKEKERVPTPAKPAAPQPVRP